jgi:hypothetical protein
MSLDVHTGDVVKYGRRDWQWGTVVEMGTTGQLVRVRRINRVWAARSDIEVVIPRKAYEGLRSSPASAFRA